ncbi:MAG: AMP-binding protein [Rikenellaceae bacterium]
MNNYNNLKELLFHALENFKTKDAFYKRNKDGYDTISFDTFITDTLKLSATLLDKGYSGKHIALIGENSYEWVVSYMAIVSASAVVVPIDKELTVKEILNIIKTSDSKVFFYSSSYDDAALEAESELGVELVMTDKPLSKHAHPSLRELIDIQTDNSYLEKIKAVEIDNDAMCSIVYTSGTTGLSKGVMLSHTNMLTDVKACFSIAKFGGNRFSVLPMHHTYEFTLGVLFSIAQGCATSINNSIKYVAQNLKIFSPTDLIIVPLIAETLYNAVWGTIRKSGKEKLVKRMITISNLLLKVGIDMRKVFFKKVHDSLGGKVHNIFCGGAHIDPAIARGYLDFGFYFNIGYGITECSPLIAGNIFFKRDKMDSCGKSIECNEIKIEDPNEDGEGHIIVKGKNVMLGYYKDQKTTDAVLIDGWFHTGDIGKYDADGFLHITGRTKNLIVLKNGKNIYPEELEGYIYQIPYVKEVVVYAEGSSVGDEVSLGAEIFPNMERLEEDNISDYNSVILNEVVNINKGLPYYKRIAHTTFRDSEFEKTTTKKIKRESRYGK